MSEIPALLKKCAEESGFVREVFNDNKTPTHQSNVLVIPFFGDIRSTFIFSSLLCKRIKDQNSSQYIVVASWAGHKGLYPYVDEFWSLSSVEKTEEIYSSSNEFDNSSKLIYLIYRTMNRYFSVLGSEEISKYYCNGLTDVFWKDFKDVERSYPSIPSTTILGEKFNSEIQKRPGFKVFVYPSKWVTHWHQGKLIKKKCDKVFWVDLIEYLLENSFVPIVHFGPLTHDVSDVFVEKCIYLNEPDLTRIMGAMRAIGCVLDLFSDIYYMSMTARCPFVSVTSRAKHFNAKDFEIDGLCAIDLPKQYIFYFPTIIDNRQSSRSVYEVAVNKMKSFIPNIDFGALPPASESNIKVSYDNVKEIKKKRRKAKFIKIPRVRELDG